MPQVMAVEQNDGPSGEGFPAHHIADAGDVSLLGVYRHTERRNGHNFGLAATSVLDSASLNCDPCSGARVSGWSSTLLRHTANHGVGHRAIKLDGDKGVPLHLHTALESMQEVGKFPISSAVSTSPSSLTRETLCGTRLSKLPRLAWVKPALLILMLLLLSPSRCTVNLKGVAIVGGGGFNKSSLAERVLAFTGRLQ